jgi:Kef-type K+ transport system membrane component KefB
VEPTTTLIHDLAVVLGTAAVTTVVCRRLGQPVVLGYLLAGLIVGPHVPIPLVANEERIRLFSELGVILVMFSIGLDFSIRRIARVIPTAGIIGVIQIGTMLWLGFMAARVLGWSTLEATFAGAAVCISSTMIVAKVFAEQGVSGRRRELVFAVLIVEDLAAVLLIAVLTALGSGAGLPAGGIAALVGRLLAFLLGVILIGFLVVPRAVRALTRLRNAETLLVACVGLCFGVALLAEHAGFSVALGAFLAGSLVAESGEGGQVERLLTPVRDIFAALFFVAVGMSVDPALMLEHWGAVVLFTLVVLIGQSASVSFGAFLGGNDLRTSVRAGMSLAQIGEFSFIIAGIGLTTGATTAPVLPVIVAVAVLTTFLTPWFVRWHRRHQRGSASAQAALSLGRDGPRGRARRVWPKPRTCGTDAGAAGGASRSHRARNWSLADSGFDLRAPRRRHLQYNAGDQPRRRGDRALSQDVSVPTVRTRRHARRSVRCVRRAGQRAPRRFDLLRHVVSGDDAHAHLDGRRGHSSSGDDQHNRSRRRAGDGARERRLSSVLCLRHQRRRPFGQWRLRGRRTRRRGHSSGRDRTRNHPDPNRF